MMQDSGLRAALRDASWWDHPDTTYPRSMHVVNEHWTSRCNMRLPLVEESALGLAAAPSARRCLRRGCREWWPTG